MQKRRYFANLFLVAYFVFAFSACGKTATENEKVSPAKSVLLTVSAAASLKDAMNEVKALYAKEHPKVNVTYNFGSSGSLQKQIENGAAVDLFVSAGKKQMDALGEKGLLLNETRKNLLGNRLVLITPKDSGLIVSFEKLGGDKIKKIALGEPKSVPAGQYAEEVFEKLKLQDKVKETIIYAKDVKEALMWVETGNADAGIVYETDAKASQKVKVQATAPLGSHKPIVYPVSVIKASKNSEEAKAYLSFMSGEKAKAVFEKYGFQALSQNLRLDE